MSSEENNNAVDGIPKEGNGKDDDETHKKSIELQEQSLGPLKEDLADWIAKTLGKISMIIKSMSILLCEVFFDRNITGKVGYSDRLRKWKCNWI